MSTSKQKYGVRIQRNVSSVTTGYVFASSEEEAKKLAATSDLDGEVVDVQQSRVLSVQKQDELANA